MVRVCASAESVRASLGISAKAVNSARYVSLSLRCFFIQFQTAYVFSFRIPWSGNNTLAADY